MSVISIEQLEQEFLINGYVVFEDFIPPEKVDELRARLTPMLENVMAQNSKVLAGAPSTGRGRVTEPLRYKIDAPWITPFSDPNLYARREVLGPHVAGQVDVRVERSRRDPAGRERSLPECAHAVDRPRQLDPRALECRPFVAR